MNDNLTKDENRVMKTSAVLGYLLLFNLGIIGLICAIVFAFDKTYIARRNMARAMLAFYGIIICLSFVIAILSAVVLNASVSTVNNAPYARFAQEFGEYSDQVSLDAANVKSQTGIRGQIINNAQMYYMTANGIVYPTDEGFDKVKGYVLPEGYLLTIKDEFDPNILSDILGNSSDEEVAYVINDGKISNYGQYGDNYYDGSATYEFYGDSNGKEYHFVTSRGQIFTLPGYPVKQDDGTIEYHIDSKKGHFYVVKGNSRIEIGNKNLNGDKVSRIQPIQYTDLNETYKIAAKEEE